MILFISAHKAVRYTLPRISKKKVNVKFYESPKEHREFSENHSNGTYTISINTAFREDNTRTFSRAALGTLIHEIQHVIQGLERSVRESRQNDVGGASSQTPFKKLKQGKLKIFDKSNNKFPIPWRL